MYANPDRESTGPLSIRTLTGLNSATMDQNGQVKFLIYQNLVQLTW